MRPRTAPLPVVISILLACGGDEAATPAAGSQVERLAPGDTTIVRTLAGSEWGEPRTMTVDLEIGILDGAPELIFGRVAWVVPKPQGGVWVYDAQVPAIREFGPDGGYVRQIGRDGEGPGEYSSGLYSVGVRSDGRLQVHDGRLARVTVYDPDGSHAFGWPVLGGFFTAEMMYLDERDHTWIKSIDFEADRTNALPLILLEYGPEGELLDTVPQPTLDDEPDSGSSYLAPSKRWTRTPDRSWLVGSTAEYRFELRREDGTVLRIERPNHRSDSVSQGEYEAYEATREWMIENQGQFMQQTPGETPRVKPHYRTLHAGVGGTYWVRLYGPVTPRDDLDPPDDGRPPTFPYREAEHYDVFDSDGTYLGEVRLPDGVSLLHVSLEEPWGTRRGEFEETYVVGLSLDPQG